ncbi:cyclophane-forming radical SAM peptide maturase AmcB [Streptomyces sp. FH025]|uniref:cyclophane-forming radical SAM peptide maturase AmcB n=1 Tax=Streptomyces sp. FH025 TaxID=2815937 RepID=UPI001A9DCA55|nr:cyclophane-forming radical SAM peptide maturase AmcB [Streptomyces sp. FH025]MBO1416712.1 radical SAM protein [Streptomyces sp. FH025]
MAADRPPRHTPEQRRRRAEILSAASGFTDRAPTPSDGGGVMSRYFSRVDARPRNLVMQPTGFCNLDCTYCYLPNRNDKTPMPVEVSEAVARSAAALVGPAGSKPLGVIWHAGEPLALGTRRFTELLQPFESLRQAGRLEHAIQTNATLINDDWCDLFTNHGFRVGVSIDGPPDLSARRVDRRGRPAFDRILRGIDKLREREVPFSLIAVVSRESITHPGPLMDFLADLGPVNIGLNIEEYEGVNTGRTPPTREEALTFWRRVIGWTRRQPADAPSVRELDRLGRYLRMTRTQRDDRAERSRIDPLPTISKNGDVYLLSPELAGINDQAYQDFRAGNVLEQPLTAILDGAYRLRYVEEFLDGLDECELTCEFFDYCRGSQAGNRYFEHHTFTKSETNYCRVAEQAPVLALADIIHQEESA